MRKSKVYLGPANTAGVFIDLERSLKSVGVDAEFIPWATGQHQYFNTSSREFKLISGSTTSFLGFNLFYFLNEYILKRIYFVHALLKYDAFFFIKPTTFFKSNIDLKILKWFNRKVYVLFVGCNDRNPSFSDREHWICNHCTDRLKQRHNLCHVPARKAERAKYFSRYSDQVFGFADNIDFIVPKGKRLSLGMRPFSIRALEKRIDSKFKILHLPSNPAMKGTELILPVLNKLESHPDVEVIVKRGVWTRSQMLSALQEGHILIDSLVEYTFGKMSLEALQYGCLPLNTYPDWIADYYDEPVVVPVEVESLENVLLRFVADHQLWRRTLAEKQATFVKYFSDKAVGAYYAEVCGFEAVV